ncbi:MAG: hypothetical protein Q8J98_11160 [Phaeovulum sp.]|uniref:hypothetical protein n=1 Tax=Phaeovulum sp. TaxID=2934796 RepID=UPI0027315ACB|nr:hypothetical protein [Phaeovulum sp.]MDP2063645.1 hypothetical protein [Phaeovulum sp.]
MPAVEIAAKDWLEDHSGRIAQECAVRLCLACCAVLPSDRAFAKLVDEQVLADLLELAFHGRRVMERRQLKSATIGSDPLWPPSSKAPPNGNLWDAFGIIIHAESLTLVWETPDLEGNPYQSSGRKPKFAGSLTAKSDQGEVKLPIGAIAASFIGSVLNQMAGTAK